MYHRKHVRMAKVCENTNPDMDCFYKTTYLRRMKCRLCGSKLKTVPYNNLLVFDHMPGTGDNNFNIHNPSIVYKQKY